VLAKPVLLFLVLILIDESIYNRIVCNFETFAIYLNQCTIPYFTMQKLILTVFTSASVVLAQTSAGAPAGPPAPGQMGPNGGRPDYGGPMDPKVSLNSIITPSFRDADSTLTQMNEIRTKLYTYYSSLTAQPQFTSVESVLATAVPDSIQQQLGQGGGLMPKGFSTASWYSALPQDVKQYISSAGHDVATIVSGADAGATPAPNVAASSASTAAATTSDSSAASSSSSASGSKSASKSSSSSKNAAAIQTPAAGGLKGAMVGVVGAVVGGAMLL
jgi:hypothetical protein